MMLIPTPWTAEALDAMLPSVAASPFGQLKTPGDVFHGSHLFTLEGGKQGALVAICAREWSHGTEFMVTGIVSTGDAGLMPGQVLESVKDLARSNGAQTVAFCTAHDALAHAAVRRAAFTRTGHVLVHHLTPGH